MSATATASSTAPPAPAAAAQKTTPWLGIVAVLFGVLASVLIGQMLSVGEKDLCGAMHLSSDEGAWLGAVYNAGQMFMGPLSVYLAGLLTPRRVLLIAAPTACVAALLAPFAPGFGSLIFVLSVLGLACGTFYPLTLSFVARSLPPKLVLFGICTYTFDVIGTLHFSVLLEGLAMHYLSWRWLFWTSMALTGPMGFFVYYGMPTSAVTVDTSKVDVKKLAPSWSGFLYTSSGLSLLYLMLTQGERLNWWTSGTIVALFVSGCFLLLAGIIRHFVRANPLVKLEIFKSRNLILLGLCLCVLRFSLLSSALVVPQFLGSVGRLLPLQYGTVLAWAAIPALFCAFCAVMALRSVDSRLVLATGFTLECISCMVGWNISSVWSRDNFALGELLLGGGAAIAICGLVCSIILELINSGIVKDPIKTLTCVAYFHTVRLFGGEVMTVILTHTITVRERFHATILEQNISQGRYLVSRQFHALAGALSGATSSSGQAAALAAYVISMRVKVQALTLSFKDAYVVEACVLTVALVIIAMIGREPLQLKDIAAKARKSHA